MAFEFGECPCRLPKSVRGAFFSPPLAALLSWEVWTRRISVGQS